MKQMSNKTLWTITALHTFFFINLTVGLILEQGYFQAATKFFL